MFYVDFGIIYLVLLDWICGGSVEIDVVDKEEKCILNLLKLKLKYICMC